MGEGTSPSRMMRSFLEAGSTDGMADSSACVYGDSGSAYSAFLGAISIILPRYMTPTRSDTCFTTFRPWAMNRYVRPNCSFSSSSRFNTCAWMDTSNADTGSHDELRVHGQGARDAHALALAARELVGVAVAHVVRQAHAL